MSQPNYDDVDFFQAPASVYQDPYPYYEYCRSHGPVWREPHHGVVMVTGYDESLEVYHDAETYSNCNAVAGPFADWPEPLEGDDVSEIIEKYRDTLAFSDQLPTFDPPKHDEHRALLGRLITPKRLKENEEFMLGAADRQIDTFVSRGECEFIEDYAGPFTLSVVADLLGVPREMHEEFRKELQGDESERKINPGVMTDEGVPAHKPLEFLYDRFTRFIEDRRRQPRDDVMTAMAHATFPDGTLPEVGDVMRIAANIFTAGQETTARLISAMFRMIGERPDLQQELRDDPKKLAVFTEECLRLETPLQNTFRLARRNSKIGDMPIPAGTTVFLIPAAANRDPRVFDDPNEFRLGRPNYRQHLAFGSGIHACAGAPLARAEGRVTAERMFARTADIRIAEKHHGPAGARRYEFADTYMLHGLRSLHLEFTPIS